MTATINASTTAGVVTTADTSGILQLQTNGTAALTVDASQNVGIGTASPAAKLELGSGTLLLPNNVFIQQKDSSGNAKNVAGVNSSNQYSFGGLDGSSTVNTIRALVAGNEAMRITSTGLVGIGTTSPTGILNVKGTGGDALPATSGSTQSAGLVTRLQQGGGIGSVMDIGGNGGGGSWIQVTEATDLATNYSLLLNPNGGNVLAGTTSSDITAVGIRLLGNNQLQVSKSSDWSLRTGRRDSTGIIQEIYYNSSRVGDIATNGTGATYNSASDYRLKENIQPMTGALARNALLNPVKYKWKVDGSDGEGFIADQLQGPFPSAVTGEKDAVDADGNPIYQSIGTGPLDGHFAACVNELQTIIQELKAIVDAQGAEIAALKGATA